MANNGMALMAGGHLGHVVEGCLLVGLGCCGVSPVPGALDLQDSRAMAAYTGSDL